MTAARSVLPLYWHTAVGIQVQELLAICSVDADAVSSSNETNDWFTWEGEQQRANDVSTSPSPSIKTGEVFLDRIRLKKAVIGDRDSSMVWGAKNPHDAR